MEAISFPKRGKEVNGNSKTNKIEEIRRFERGKFELTPYRIRFHRSNIPYPWYKVYKIILKYITSYVRHTEAFGTHIILLNHFKL